MVAALLAGGSCCGGARGGHDNRSLWSMARRADLIGHPNERLCARMDLAAPTWWIWWRADTTSCDARVDPAVVDGLSGLIQGFSFFFVFSDRFTEVGIRTASTKVTINCDLSTEAVGRPISVKRFCPSPLKLM